MNHEESTAASDSAAAAPEPVLEFTQAALKLGGRELWSGLDLTVRAGEFWAILGANGSGKSSLLRTVLGQLRLERGDLRFHGQPVSSGDRRIGYVPQQRIVPIGTPMRARDLVALGLNGHRFGVPWTSRADRIRVDAALETVGATGYANAPVGELSGGEQQRLRIAQGLVGDPHLLLTDEPLLSLDLHHQRAVCELIDQRRHDHDTPVLFVTHDINPILNMTDRILYLAGGRFRIGTPDDVLRSEVLSELYGTEVEVIRARGQIIVAGVPHGGAHHHPEVADGESNSASGGSHG